jgi:hypothetical protein
LGLKRSALVSVGLKKSNLPLVNEADFSGAFQFKINGEQEKVSP